MNEFKNRAILSRISLAFPDFSQGEMSQFPEVLQGCYKQL